ncbi:peroxisome biogenesis protein 22-like [Primulina tabacum]|uniref:peroxisome biogenesis protein 22-like n=1 Tax=Primulina tabacum TaxID=48773 RepID=UPI003F5A59C1
MADNSREDLLRLVKRVGAFLTVKISNIFRHMDSRSVGAIAGLAFALVFTWRLLRTPRGPPRSQPKRQASTTGSSGVSSHANVNDASSQVGDPSEDSRTQNVIDEFFQPVKPTLAQIVRQRLSEGRKVTCRLLDVILEESSPEELQKQATVKSSILEVLLEVTKFCDLYLMERVLDDQSEKNVLVALEEAGVFTSGGLVKDKVLFCSTETGRSSFVRQLEPDWHIDSNPEIVNQLSRFIKYLLHISSVKLERPPSNVVTAASLERYFGIVLMRGNLGSCTFFSCFFFFVWSLVNVMYGSLIPSSCTPIPVFHIYVYQINLL